MLNKMMEKVERIGNSIQSLLGNDTYRYEKIQNDFVYDDGRVVRAGFDTIVKIDQNGNIRDYIMVRK